MNDIIGILNGLVGGSNHQSHNRSISQQQSLLNAAMQQAAGPAYQAAMAQMLQQRRPCYVTAALGPSVFSGPLAGLGQVMRPPTEREIAEAELKAFLGDDLWNMEWMR